MLEGECNVVNYVLRENITSKVKVHLPCSITWWKIGNEKSIVLVRLSGELVIKVRLMVDVTENYKEFSPNFA